MNALVTGVAGFIGSHLAERLIAQGGSVVGLDCFTDYYARELKNANLTTLRAHGSFRFVDTSIQAAPWPELLSGITHIFHLAAQAGVRKSWGQDFSNLHGVQHRSDPDPSRSVCRGSARAVRLRFELVGLR